MYSVSATIDIRIRKEDCEFESSPELHTWLSEQIAAAHKDVVDRFTELGFSVETSGIRFYFPKD